MTLLRHLAALMLSAMIAAPVGMAADVAGRFDYYILSLSWSPGWCASTGETDHTQCRRGSGTGFLVHGLWPQYEHGWPQDCRTTARDPSRSETAAMKDVMGSVGLAWHEWRKHGRCTGLDPKGYFSHLREAAESVVIPPVLEEIDRDLRLPARVIEDAFIEVNPGLTRDAITVRCDNGRLTELRICLTRDLALRDCAPDARRDCSGNFLMDAPP